MHHIIVAAVCAALFGIAYSLWQRRITWACPWERILTLSVAFQGAGLALGSPLGNPLDGVLQQVTGLYGLSTLVGTLMGIGAMAAFTYAALSRAVTPRRLDWFSPRFIRLPGASAGSFLIFDCLLTDMHNHPGALHSSHPHGCVIAYWLVFCGVKLYLLFGAGFAFMLLRRFPRHRRIAEMYLAACVCGMAANITRIATLPLPQYRPVADVLVWIFCSLWAAGFTLAAAHSWRRKVQVFQPLLQAVRT
jgi:hypothetical protein